MEMDLRSQITAAIKDAMKAKDADRLATLRLMNADIKKRDIDARGEGKEPLTDPEVVAALAKMVKQRQESVKMYNEGGRPELADKETAEISVIEGFLPKQLSEAETQSAVEAAIEEVGATSIKDMGKVMGALKAKYTGQLDFGKVGGLVKSKLG